MADVDRWVETAAQKLMEQGKIPLPGSEDPAYQSWLTKTGVNGAATDYDTYQAFRAGLQPDERGHLNDTYKKPNHITFSNESVYHGKDGAEGGQWIKAGDGWAFAPSEYNLQVTPKDQMKSYFDKYEPDSVLIFPDGEHYLRKGPR